ncbi:MAG: triose-phosphate isomerase [Candidatus Krumholzibacteria bacterium]|nr:triose-phosphate isomerase [Candidatus Krumholzibacteria bacterium]
MTRPKIIAGNWKMNLDHIEGAALARAVRDRLSGPARPCEVVLIPPFTSLEAVAGAIEGSPLRIGAQDLWYEPSGAFTGEISASMLAALGCRYVLIGHSERRHVIGEDGTLLSRKLRAALAGGLFPIYCVGELLEDREAGNADGVVERQLREGLGGLEPGDAGRVVIAYEPVWAIGTGRNATPEDAGAMHQAIRRLLADLFGEPAAGAAVILYGGSVKPDNARDLLSREGIDGALVGGASLDPGSFAAIVSAL